MMKFRILNGADRRLKFTPKPYPQLGGDLDRLILRHIAKSVVREAVKANLGKPLDSIAGQFVRMNSIMSKVTHHG